MTLAIANVIIRGGIPIYEIPTPLISPIANPIRGTITSVSGIFIFSPLKKYAEITTPKERRDPTDRSMPPEITTKDWPNATIPRKTDSLKTLIRCVKLIKPGKIISPKANNKKTATMATNSLLERTFFKKILDKISLLPGPGIMHLSSKN